MSVYSLERTQFFPIPIEPAWDFFSSPENLRLITPPWLDFRITSEPPKQIYPGLIIRYEIKPMFSIPLKWITEITQVRKPHYFVDEQRMGPYKFWHHEHLFIPVPGGVEMRDVLHYSLPYGLLGTWVHSLLVRKKIEDIFYYRRFVLQQMFTK